MISKKRKDVPYWLINQGVHFPNRKHLETEEGSEMLNFHFEDDRRGFQDAELSPRRYDGYKGPEDMSFNCNNSWGSKVMILLGERERYLPSSMQSALPSYRNLP
jgi:hypothetical protein